jgi:diketogulonate reductase-like aldo/keto reductase
VLLLHQLFPSLGQAYIAWEVFEEVQRRGGVRHIGICQVDLPTLKPLYAKAGVGLMVVQNYFASSTNFDKDVRRLCKQNGIYYQAFGAFSAENSALSDHAVVARAIDTLEVGKTRCVDCGTASHCRAGRQKVLHTVYLERRTASQRELEGL